MTDIWKQKRQETPNKSQGYTKKKLFKSDRSATGANEMEKMSGNSSSSPQHEPKIDAACPAGSKSLEDGGHLTIENMMVMFQKSLEDFEDRMEKRFDNLTQVIHEVKESFLFHKKECAEKNQEHGKRTKSGL